MIDSDAAIDFPVDDSSSAPLHAQFHDDHDARLALCAKLEQVADMLPSLPAPARIRRICGQIDCVATLHFRRADALLAQLVRGREAPVLTALCKQVGEMHAMDAIHGEDLINLFWDSTARGAVTRPGEFGYMLRCYFDGCRRAIALERALLVLLYSDRGHRDG
ncbi:MAG: hypothetical protein ABI240_00245 [Sphingomonas sp.]